MSSAATLSAERLRRFRWRARRGLLENDILLSRYLDSLGDAISNEEAAGLDILLELSDRELLDLILQRTEPQGEVDVASARAVLGAIRKI